jgi:hypothetical protein
MERKPAKKPVTPDPGDRTDGVPTPRRASPGRAIPRRSSGRPTRNPISKMAQNQGRIERAGHLALEILNLSITAGDDVAFCSSLNGSTGTNKDDANIEMCGARPMAFARLTASG